MIKRFWVILTITTVANFASQAQTSQDSIKAVINSLFSGMQKADSAMVKNAFTPFAIMQDIQMGSEGVKSVNNSKPEDFARSIGQAKPGMLDERIEYASILIDGDMAAVWTPYKFYVNGKLSHCGVNSFQLVRLKEGWRIQYIIDTRRRAGCE